MYKKSTLDYGPGSTEVLSALLFYQLTLFLVDLFIRSFPARSVIPDPKSIFVERGICVIPAQENRLHSGTGDLLLLTYCGSE